MVKVVSTYLLSVRGLRGTSYNALIKIFKMRYLSQMSRVQSDHGMFTS